MEAKPAPTAPVRIHDARSGHKFRNARGHLRADTPENRSLLEQVANNPDSQLGTDKFGNRWAAENLPDGTQVWTQRRGGEIINGGVNTTPRNLDSLIVLSAENSTMAQDPP